MKSNNEKFGCDATLDQLEAFVDDALPEAIASLAQHHIEGCPRCQVELKLAQRIRTGLGKLPSQRCPEHVTRAVLAAANQPPHRLGWRARVFGWLPPMPALDMRVVAAAGVALALVIAGLLVRPDGEGPAPQFTQAELARAEIQLKSALGYVGKMSQRSGRLVRDEALAPHVVQPMQEAVEAMFQIRPTQKR